MKKFLVFSWFLWVIEIFPQTTEPIPFWVVNGTVSAIAIHDSSLYVGGAFDYAGPASGHAVLINANSPNDKLNYPYLDGTVNVIIPDGNDGWYLGGAFTKVGDKERNNAAHVSSDGSVSDWNPDVTGEVYSLSINNNDVYIGGKFDHVGGQERISLAKVNNSTGAVDMNWICNINTGDYYVYAIASLGDYLYIGGYFTMAGTLNRSNLARTNLSTGVVDPSWNPEANDVVYCIYPADTGLFMGGYFSSLFGKIQNCIARFSTAGEIDSTWAITLTGRLTSITGDANDLFLGGMFLKDGVWYGDLVKVKKSSGELYNNWTTFPKDIDNIVKSVFVQGNALYVGRKRTTSFPGEPYLKKQDKVTGVADSNFIAAGGNVYSITGVNGKLYIGGGFTSAGGYAIYNLAKINIRTGAADPAWRPNPDKWVRAVTYDNGFVYIGGSFNTIGSVVRSGIARINSSSGALDTWYPNIPSIGSFITGVDKIFIDSMVYVFKKDSPKQIYKVSKSGVIHTEWTPNIIQGILNQVELLNGYIYVSGIKYFVKLNNTTGARDYSFKPTVDPYVLKGKGNYLYFTSRDQSYSPFAGRVNKNTGAQDSVWKTTLPDPVYTFGISNNFVYMSGGQSYNADPYLIKVGVNSGRKDTIALPENSYSIEDIQVQDTNIYMGGSFYDTNKNLTRNFVLFIEHDIDTVTVDTTHTDTTHTDTLHTDTLHSKLNSYSIEQNYPNPFNPDTKIKFFLPQDGMVTIKVYNILGEEVRLLINEILSQGEHVINFDGKNLSSGVYFYKLEAGSYVQTRKMVLLR